jgi:hypothetical protein
MTDIEKAEYDDVIRQLTTRLRETVDENDRLRAELARAYATLSDIHRNRDLPAAVRAKAAIGCIQHELPRLTPEPRPLELTAAPPEPLAVVVERQRARLDRMLALPLEVRSELSLGVVRNDCNGAADASDDELFGLRR